MTQIHFSQVRENFVLRFLGLLAIVFVFTILAAQADERHEKQTTEASSETTGALDETTKQENESKDSGNSSDAADEKPWIAPDSTLYKAVKYTGKYHIMVLHFPIAFLIGAAVVQWYLVARGKGASVVAVMMWFGALGAVAAAALDLMAFVVRMFSKQKPKAQVRRKACGQIPGAIRFS